MNVVSIEKFAQEQLGEHSEQVETYGLGRFMDDMHSDDDSQASEADQGSDGVGRGEL